MPVFEGIPVTQIRWIWSMVHPVCRVSEDRDGLRVVVTEDRIVRMYLELEYKRMVLREIGDHDMRLSWQLWELVENPEVW